MKSKTLTASGLEVYEKLDVWQISEDRNCAYFATVGICISIRYYDDDSVYLNTNWKNKFVAEVQYDYRNPDTIDNFAFVKLSGTYGHHLFFNTLDEAMKGCEDFLDEDFEGVCEFYDRKIISTTKLPRKEVAKKAFFHHYGMFPDLHDFRTSALKDTPYFEEYVSYRDRYKNRADSDEKYRLKIDKVFLEEFGFDVSTIQYNWRVSVRDFLQKIDKPKADRDVLKKELSPRQFKIFDKIFKYYHI